MKAEKKIAVFGVGLIGGSFSLALKKAGMVREVVGFGRSSEALEQAKNLSIIDRVGSIEDVRDADVVLIATPVGQMQAVMKRIAPFIGKDTLVTDGGSTKCDVVEIARAEFGEKLPQFVPGHPIAGAENSGPSAARDDLYVGKKVVLTPLHENPPELVEKAKKIWEACGANVTIMKPEEHDGVFATVSHLPHLLSFALVHDISVRENRD
ncbi:MAG TPA: prephenate dehydrogenase/arogenate dehydrogenase family protein, partial [Burkholderiales bacterium]|nr:prephenate dehydrogenase/arogenate dehydrogenase family protein [Burkholderiales bacterium]